MAKSNPYKKQEEEHYTFKRWLSDLLEIIEAVVISVFVILLSYAYVLRPVDVDGPSMMPTLYDKDKLIMWKLGYTPKDGDVVIIDADKSFVFADESETELVESEPLGIRIVKRVIATAGETIYFDFEKGKVCRDGVFLDEPYISEPTTQDEYAFDYPITIPEGYVFVMGDNRPNSTDSRDSHVGLVPVDQVVGHVVLRVYRSAEHCSGILHWLAVIE